MRTTLLYCCLIAIVFFTACHKDSSPPANPPTRPTSPLDTALGTMNINLTYPWTAPGARLELIISEPGGKVLLDSIASGNTTIKAALKTNATLVDMTIIDTSGFRSITVYKSVNPSTWVTAVPGNYMTRFRASDPNAVTSRTIFRNFPAAAITDGNAFDSYIFNNGPINALSGSSYNPLYNTLDVSYWRSPGKYNYLVLPHLGLYKLWIPTGTNDTLDLSRMDTVNSLTFTRTTPFSLIYLGCSFLGILDTTDRSKDISFLDPFTVHIAANNADLQYPKLPMQLYELSLDASISAKEFIGYYSWGKTIPNTPVFPDPASFQVTGTQNNNFSVNFTNPASTAFYTTYWENSNYSTRLYVYAPADTSAIHPVSVLTNQKSKLLAGVSISDVVLKEMMIINIPGFSYSGYFSYTCDPSQVTTHKITTSSYYLKYF